MPSSPAVDRRLPARPAERVEDCNEPNPSAQVRPPTGGTGRGRRAPAGGPPIRPAPGPGPTRGTPLSLAAGGRRAGPGRRPCGRSGRSPWSRPAYRRRGVWGGPAPPVVPPADLLALTNVGGCPPRRRAGGPDRPGAGHHPPLPVRRDRLRGPPEDRHPRPGLGPAPGTRRPRRHPAEPPARPGGGPRRDQAGRPHAQRPAPRAVPNRRPARGPRRPGEGVPGPVRRRPGRRRDDRRPTRAGWEDVTITAVAGGVVEVAVDAATGAWSRRCALRDLGLADPHDAPTPAGRALADVLRAGGVVRKRPADRGMLALARRLADLFGLPDPFAIDPAAGRWAARFTAANQTGERSPGGRHLPAGGGKKCDPPFPDTCSPSAPMRPATRPELGGRVIVHREGVKAGDDPAAPEPGTRCPPRPPRTADTRDGGPTPRARRAGRPAGAGWQPTRSPAGPAAGRWPSHGWRPRLG